LTVKAFLDIQDDNLPKLVVCQALSVGVGITVEQFGWFFRQSEEQISMVILEAAPIRCSIKPKKKSTPRRYSAPFSSLNLSMNSAATAIAAAYYVLLFCI
jgi:hypothetical protein